MKKKVIFLTVISILLIATVTMASGILVSGPITSVTIGFEPEFDHLASYMGYNTDEKFEKFHSVALFMGKYCTTEESFSYLEEMILSGCDPDTVMDIYQFYLTTNEDISIVRQIYDMVYTGEPITNRDASFESAFNEITNNKCGVLTEEDVVSYLEKGLSVEDITQANLLCRKGVLTIQEILDLVLSGTSWEKIEKAVCVNDTTRTKAAEQLTERIKETNQKLKSQGLWKGKKSENFDKIAKIAEKKGVSEEKLTELLDKGYSELDILNTVENNSFTVDSIDSILAKEVSEQ